jgi:hypothetical protein
MSSSPRPGSNTIAAGQRSSRATDGRPAGTLLVVCAGSTACAPRATDGAVRSRDGGHLPRLGGWAVRMIGTVSSGRDADPPGSWDPVTWDSVLRAAGADPVRVDLAPLPTPETVDVPAATWARPPAPGSATPLAPPASNILLTREFLAARFLVGELGFIGESVTVSLRGAELLRMAGEGIVGRSGEGPGLRIVAVRAALGSAEPTAPSSDGRLAQVRAAAVAQELVTAGLPGSRVVVAPPARSAAAGTGAGTEPSVEIWELSAA